MSDVSKLSSSVDELSDAINAANPALTTEETRLTLALYELLAEGRPARVDDLAERSGRDEAWISERLDRWSGVFRDEDGSVVAFWGLAILEMPHRFETNGHTLYTWCAFDPLFIAPMLGTTARVSSTCPVTKTTITLTVDANGVRDIDPPDAVLSFISPEERLGDDVIEAFCHFIHLFASRDAAEAWVKEHPGTFVLSIDDAFDVGRRTLGRLSGARAER